MAGRVNILGQLVLSYRNCNESLPVLCEVQSTEVTTLSSSVSSTYTHTAGSTSTITSIGNIIDNAGKDNEKLTQHIFYTKIFFNILKRNVKHTF